MSIGSGEFFSLLGPSGCGKTTTLRLIGGFERPDAGPLLLDGEDISTTPPEKRPVNTVFQSYALFPHLTVERNVAFGLRFHDGSRPGRHAGPGGRRAAPGAPRAARRRASPHQLSGGQQQRVALARALVLRPGCCCSTSRSARSTPSSARTLQLELAALQREVGITFVYVTHDQEEALTMSDRLAVMRDGEVEQFGAPREIYENPANRVRRRLPRRGQPARRPSTSAAAGCTSPAADVQARRRRTSRSAPATSWCGPSGSGSCPPAVGRRQLGALPRRAARLRRARSPRSSCAAGDAGPQGARGQRRHAGLRRRRRRRRCPTPARRRPPRHGRADGRRSRRPPVAERRAAPQSNASGGSQPDSRSRLLKSSRALACVPPPAPAEQRASGRDRRR